MISYIQGCKTKIISALLIPALWLMCFGGFHLKLKADDLGDALEIIKAGLYDFDESIDVSGFKIRREELEGIYSLIIKNDPYLFFVSRLLSFSYNSEGIVLTLKPRYLFDADECFVAWELCREKVNEIAEYARIFAESDLELALFVHDYICLHYDYDDSLKNDNIWDFFTLGSGTCQAYTLTYIAVLRELGIETVFVASDSISHIWNLVKIEDLWYHVDLTWDDSSHGNVSRRHFLCSDKMAEERGHRDWYSPVADSCLSEKYRNFDFDECRRYADINHDGYTNIVDLSLLNGYLKSQNSDICICCSDLDGNGLIDAGDTDILRKKILKNE